MGQIILTLANLLCVALVAGISFGVWLGSRPFQMSAAFYVEQQQHAIRRLNTAMPSLGGFGTLLTLGSLWVTHTEGGSVWLQAVALAALAAAGMVTRFGNQPINARVMQWSIATPPPDWAEWRDRWWRWHVMRTLACILALSCLILSALLNSR